MQLLLPSPLKPGVKSRMKMQLEQRRQAMLPLYLGVQQSIAYYGVTYIQGFVVIIMYHRLAVL